LDSKGDPLPFASVVVKGTTTGVTTNAEGFFSLALPSGASTLVFSSVGLASTEAKVSRGFMSIVLNDTEKQLSEVVVTAYGTRRSSDDNDYATDDRSQ
jgi:iron complex outermembrane receptor protein